MKITQLELALWQELREAELTPQDSDLRWLCQGLEVAIAATPKAQKLQVAGEAVLLIAGILKLRAEGMLTDWEQAHSLEGPTLEADDLSQLIRQSMALELDDLIAEPEPVTRQPKKALEQSAESVAGIVDKAALLEAFESEINLAENQGQDDSGAVSVAHAENVTAWASAISQWLKQYASTQPISLWDLQQGVAMPLVEVWLGLLGIQGVKLNQQGSFYDSNSIFISG